MWPPGPSATSWRSGWPTCVSPRLRSHPGPLPASRYRRAHAGMLPATGDCGAAGPRRLLKVICGTTPSGRHQRAHPHVVFTGLSKWDGSTSRLLSAREFHQIAGRAGRAGYDQAGSVVVQAPEHIIETERALAKGRRSRKRRKVVRPSRPRVCPLDRGDLRAPGQGAARAACAPVSP